MKSGLVLLFSLTAFLASFLLFWAEPMIGKMVLPLFGGTPAVWNTCLVYFQLILLCGYAAFGGGLIPRGHQDRVASPLYLVPLGLILALGCVAPPIAPVPSVVGPESFPAVRLFWTLATSFSIPLLMVTAAAPLVQNWFSMTGHPRAHDPYFLYAASNAGSLLALLAYPFAIEPNLSLDAQARLWRAGFILVAIALLTCGLIARRTRQGQPIPDVGQVDDRDPAPPTRPIVRTAFGWLVLVFIPSSWLMGVTTYLTTDLAPMPLLWVIPLALYLSSFIVAFVVSDSAVVKLAGRVMPFLILALALVLSAGFVHAFWIPLHLLAFFAGAIACHGALAQRRPKARFLPSFYVTIALGGLLGGVFNAILAPLLFNRVVEYPLAIVLGTAFAAGPDPLAKFGARYRLLGDLLLPGAVFLLTALLATNRAGLADSLQGVAGVMVASGLAFYALVTARRRPLRFALAVGAVLAASGLTQGVNGRLLHIERNFFGVVRVTEDADHDVHRLFHGSTLHGQQSLDPALAREPSTYFTRSGPIGQLFAALGPRIGQAGTRVAIVGLGTGTLAAYAQPTQDWTFYEIDPAIERIARDARYFSYLRDCKADSLDVVLGDARLRLREAPDRAYGLIVLDAFSSDSLPVHLVTREAIRLYRSKLAEGGVLAFNLSNRYLDLDPLMGRQAADAGLVCRIRYDTLVSEKERQAGKQPSIWAVMAASEGDLGSLADDARWHGPSSRPGSRAWTDDYSDLASYLRWRPVRPTSD
jgi:SAM-dependent methyltransferase